MKHNSKKIAIFALTKPGAETAAKLAEKIPNSVLVIPEKFKDQIESSNPIHFFAKGTFSQLLTEEWNKYNGHIFIMATGIVVRQISKLIRDKTKDPAVVVCDEKGEYAISLLSGHIGGANRLAKLAAKILDGNAVITTATDVQGVMAFDELATIKGWRIINSVDIKYLNSMLLEGRKIAVLIPEPIYVEYYSTIPNIYCVTSLKEIINGKFDGAVVMTEACNSNLENALICDIKTLYFSQ